MILADTSAWVEYDRATGSRADQRLSELIAGDGPLPLTESVVMEVLAGAHGDARAADLRRCRSHPRPSATEWSGTTPRRVI